MGIISDIRGGFLRLLVAALFAMVCYQLGYNVGYDHGAPIRYAPAPQWPSPPPESAKRSESITTVADASSDRTGDATTASRSVTP